MKSYGNPLRREERYKSISTAFNGRATFDERRVVASPPLATASHERPKMHNSLSQLEFAFGSFCSNLMQRKKELDFVITRPGIFGAQAA